MESLEPENISIYSISHVNLIRFWISCLIRAGAALGNLLLLASCHKSPDIGYQVIVTVTDGGVHHSGTGIWHSGLVMNGISKSYKGYFEGEAIPIDLGSGRTIYALIVGRDERGHPTSDDDIQVYGSHLFRSSSHGSGAELVKSLTPIEEYQKVSRMVGQKAYLNCSKPGITSCPFLVEFKKDSDPTTVEAINPPDLSKKGLNGIRLEQVSVTITDKPATFGNLQKLNWLTGNKEQRLDVNYKGSVAPTLSQELSHGAFRQGKN